MLARNMDGWARELSQCAERWGRLGREGPGVEVSAVSHLSSHWEAGLGFSTDSLPGTGKGLHPWPHLPPTPSPTGKVLLTSQDPEGAREGGRVLHVHLAETQWTGAVAA